MSDNQYDFIKRGNWMQNVFFTTFRKVLSIVKVIIEFERASLKKYFKEVSPHKTDLKFLTILISVN